MHGEINDVCANKLDDFICLCDTLFHDDDALKQLDERVFKETLAGEFDAPATMDGLGECSGFDVDLVECSNVLLVA